MDWGTSIPGYLGSAAIRATGLAAIGGAAIGVLRVRSAAGRHAVWTVATAGMLLMAALDAVLPVLPLRVLQAPPAEMAVIEADPPAPPETELRAPRIERKEAPRSTPSFVPIAAAARASISWRQTMAALYLCGVLVCLARLLSSYRFTRRLVWASCRVDGLQFRDVLESRWIAVPVTLGFRHPKILLPEGWREWQANKLAAVMEHEGAHVRRADWAIAVLAAVNRCVFWFHPLAWWLERRLSALAEQAADDAALLALGARAEYAQTLWEMAAAVRADRGRMVREAIAMAKTAEVRKRIERILDETRQIPRGLTRSRWAMLAGCGALFIFLGAAVQLAPAQVAAILAPAVRSTGVVFYASATAPAVPVRKATPPAGIALHAAAVAEAPVAEDAPPPPPQRDFHVTFYTSTIASSQAPYAYRFSYESARTETLQKVDPIYPTAATVAGIEGDVQLQLVIGADGRVKSLRPLSGDAVLAAAAEEAVRQWTYRPKTMPNGEPMEFETMVTIPFRLNPESATAPAPMMAVRQPLQQPVGTLLVSRPPGLAMPVLLSKTEPVYDLPQRAAGVQGTVALSAVIDAKGRPENIQITEPVDPVLDANAVDAVNKWKFMPARQDGLPQDCAVSIFVNYRLVNDSMPTRMFSSPQRGNIAAENTQASTNRMPAVVSSAPVELTESERGKQPGGPVTLSVLVTADGGIRQVRVARSQGIGLDERAMSAVKKWKFQPALRDGRPVDYWTTVDVDFE